AAHHDPKGRRPHGRRPRRWGPRQPQPPALGGIPRPVRRRRAHARRLVGRSGRARALRGTRRAAGGRAARTRRRAPAQRGAPVMPAFSMEIDLYPLLAATLSALVCALLGIFLVLRRLSLMGDAISHAVLPGLV